MRDFQVPSFRTVAFGGAAWLAGIALLLVIPFSGFASLGDLLVREIIGGVFILAAVYLFRMGLTERGIEESSRAMAREAIRRIERDRSRRAA